MFYRLGDIVLSSEQLSALLALLALLAALWSLSSLSSLSTTTGIHKLKYKINLFIIRITNPREFAEGNFGLAVDSTLRSPVRQTGEANRRGKPVRQTGEEN